MSDNIGITALTTNQSGKEVTINNAFSAYDAALTERLAVNLTNDVTLTAPQYRGAIYFDITTTGTGKKLTLQAIKRFVVIKNNGTLTCSIKLGATEIALAVGFEALTYTDGTANGVSVTLIGSTLPTGGIGVATTATNALTVTVNPSDGETVTIGTQVYTFQTAFTAGLGHVKIGAAIIDSLTNLARCINQTGVGAGTLYDNSATVANTNVTATEASPMVVTSVATGTQFNSVATTETMANGAWTTSTLTGGKSRQFLAKTTDADFDVNWYDPPVSTVGGGGGGGGGGAGSGFLPERALVTPTTSTFGTTVNGTGLTVTNVSDGVMLACASSAANHMRGVCKSFHAGDWTAYARFTRGWLIRNYFQGGLFVRESATGKIIVIYVGGDITVDQLFTVVKWDSADAQNASPVILRSAAEQEPRTWWIKLQYVSGSTPNYTISMSWDGVTWFAVTTFNKTTFFTTNGDQVGISINPILQSGSDTQYLTCSSYEETSP